MKNLKLIRAIIVLVFIGFLFWGYCLNLWQIFHYAGEQGITFVLKIAGIVLFPIGAVMGFIG